MNGIIIGRRGFIFGGAALLATVPAFGKSKQEEARREAILTEALPPVAGPKRTIAVGQFDVIGPYANPSVQNVGGAIAAMLSTALQESNRFLLVERNALPSLITEQELGKAGVAGGNLAAKPGQVFPAQYLVVGSVTEFTTPGSGKGSGLTIGGTTGLGLGRSVGVLGLDLRIIDTRTSGVVSAFKVREKTSATTVGLNTQWRGRPIATNQFFNTPVGAATRAALNKAVLKIAQAIGAIPWSGQVVEVEGGLVYVNAGAEAGLVVGDRLNVQQIGRVFTDPGTGEVLSQRLATIGQVTIESIEPKLSSGLFQPASNVVPNRGDLVVYAR